MSEIKVDTVAEKTSANGVTVDGLNIKDSKLVTANSVVETNLTDNIVTLAKMASGTDGNIISYDASGNPVAIATGNDGMVLTSTGAGSPPAFEVLPSSGLTTVDQWRYTGGATFTSEAVVDASLERVDTTGQGTIGSAMTQSSGIFTFPQTGVYLVNFHCNFYKADGDTRYALNQIRITTNNSSYTSAAQGYQSIKAVSSATYGNVLTSTLVDVTSTSNVKIAFAFASDAAVILQGSTDKNFTHMTFLRLGDT